MDLELTILGSSSAIPLVRRNPTAQFLTIANRHFLIDCGEGTQVRLRENKIGFSRINHIFISHLHGDHFFGLAPLLSSLHLLDRQKEMHIYAPAVLKDVIHTQMKAQGSWLKYPIVYHDLDFDSEQLLFEDEKVRVKSFPLKHTIDCCGFLFEEKPLARNIRKEALRKYKIPVVELSKIKFGADWTDENGKVIPNTELTLKPRSPFSYAFCTDTAPVDNLLDFVKKPSLLYHEATFTEKYKERAATTKHSTAQQAASIAQLLEAEKLLIGHFSARYNEFNELLNEAKAVFENTWVAEEGKTYVLKDKSKEWNIKA
jgi:ribonuclease Z